MFNSVLITNPDNSKMQSKKTKEEQMIFGFSAIDIVRRTLGKEGKILEMSDLDGSQDHILFYMTNAPLLEFSVVRSKIEQYRDDMIFFKDIHERPVALYIPVKVLDKCSDTILGEWVGFAELTLLLEMPYRVEVLDELLAIESKQDLNEVTRNKQLFINNKHINNGATIIDINTTYIDFDVVIGMDTTIYPNSFIQGDTKIGEDCTIGPDARLQNAVIGNRTSIKDSTVLDSSIDDDTKVGPYAYVRPNSKIGSKVKVGDFVEIKNATIGDGTKISHLSYVGDADLGKNINVACGVVFVNYNGKEKSRSVIKDDAFIGCNVNIVAPVEVDNLAYVAAGTTVTKNVPAGALAVGRARQENKEGWVERRKLIQKKS